MTDFHEVFQELRESHPGLSMGALQQKTMKRMNEMKAEKEKQAKQKEEDERINKLANNALKKWMAKVKRRPSKPGDQNQEKAPLSETQRPKFRRSSNNDRHVSDEDSCSSREDENKAVMLAQKLQMSTGIRRSLTLRRGKIDLNESDEKLCEEAVETNFAPKRLKSTANLAQLDDSQFEESSKGDDNSMLSNHSFLSEMDYGVILDKSEKSRKKSESEGDSGVSRERALLMGVMNASDKSGSAEGKASESQETEDNDHVAECFSVPIAQCPCLPNMGDRLDTTTHSYLSCFSDYSVESSGLIVGFKAQTTGPGGFAADFSAWDNRKQGSETA